MSSINLGEITSKFHESRGTTRRLERLASSWQPGDVYTLDRLYDLVEPSSMRVLSLILGELTRHGILQQLVRVESPTGAGIKDFSSILDVPHTIHDSHSDRDIEVGPENLQVVFKVPDAGRR
jgi:hypothetical protein